MGRPNANIRTASSVHFQTYPEVTSEINLLTDGPSKQNGQDMARKFRVLGSIADGDSAMLVVRRQDSVDVPIPIPFRAVGLDFDVQISHLLPYTVSAVRLNGDADDNDDALTLTGTPAADYEFKFEITTTGGLNAGAFRWSDDGGDTWTESGVTIPADGTHTLGATGMTAVFDDVSFTDNDIYQAESFVTTADNIFVEW